MLSIIDLVIIVVYIAATVTIGICARGRQEDAADYYTTKGGMGGALGTIMVGLSIAAALFSGISFLAYPSIAYVSGLGILLTLTGLPLAWVILRFWFWPHYMHSDTKYPYDIIENRLGPHVRTLAAGMYTLLRIGWMAALIYAPTIAIMAAAGLSDKWFWPIVITIGLSSTLYTTLGGIRGIITTDAIQFSVIAVGITITLITILTRLPVSLGEAASYLNSEGYLEFFDFSIDPTKLITFWSILIALNISNFSMYMADQMSLQRYLATGNIKAASRSFLVNMAGVIVVVTLLLLVGVSLKLWYHFTPDPNIPGDPDKIFPFFVATQLPTGIAGLLLAAILAATMSSMTGGINTLSATLTIDFRSRFGSAMTDKAQLRFGKITSLVIGSCATFVAGVVGALGTIFEMTQAILGVFLGPILACMFFAVIRSKIHSAILIAGLFAGLFAGTAVIATSVANIWVSAVSFFTSVIAASLLNSIIKPFKKQGH